MSVLEERYASNEMRDIWSREKRYAMERRFWVSVMRAQQRAGVAIPDAAIEDYATEIENISIESIDARELKTHHDVKARIDEFNSVAGHQFIHLGMTSRDLTENIEAIQIRDSILLIRAKTASLLSLLGKKCNEFADLAMVARTHNVPAQVTTLGKRFANWAEELIFAFDHLNELSERLPMRGIKGATGTNVDAIELLGERYLDVEKEIASSWGFDSTLTASAQVYPRSFDFEFLSSLIQLSAAPSNIATNVRLMSGFGLVAEGFSEQQVGSSAMPHKVNPRLSERINALAVILKGYLVMLSEISGDQWNEGDVSCSAVRRVALPDACYAIDAILDSTRYVVERLTINTRQIDHELQDNLPELCSSVILNLAIKAGARREDAYQAIKSHAKAARTDFQSSGERTFIRRICEDTSLGISTEQFDSIVKNPINLAGSAPQQARTLANRIATEITAKFAESNSFPEAIR